MIGVILAGGASTRMGRTKALVPLHGRPLISYAVSALQPVTDHVVISANAEEPYAFLRLPVVPDVYLNCGPLAGIHAALRYAGGDAIVVTSCDMPFVSSALILHLLHSSGTASACVASIDGRIHPLLGVYRTTCLKPAESHLMSGRLKMHHFLKEVGGHSLPLTPDIPGYTSHCCFNINSDDDLKLAQSLIA